MAVSGNCPLIHKNLQTQKMAPTPTASQTQSCRSKYGPPRPRCSCPTHQGRVTAKRINTRPETFPTQYPQKPKGIKALLINPGKSKSNHPPQKRLPPATITTKRTWTRRTNSTFPKPTAKEEKIFRTTPARTPALEQRSERTISLTGGPPKSIPSAGDGKLRRKRRIPVPSCNFLLSEPQWNFPVSKE